MAENPRHRSPTPRLLAGLAITLIAAAGFSWYSLRQIDTLRELQTETIDRNRKDSLQLLRIQSDLNSLGLAMRDMVDAVEPYPLVAWRGELERIRYDLEDALKREGALSNRPPAQQNYLNGLVRQFWTSTEQILAIAGSGEERRARQMIVNSLQAQQSAIAATVARLLVANHEAEEQALSQIQLIHDRVERNIYIFLIAMMATIAGIGVTVIYSNRRIFAQITELSTQTRTLARRLISVQEEVFKSVSRELHDEFGQILTAIGTMLTRAERKGLPADSPVRADVQEVKQIVQSTLEKMRSFSQALHPAILDDYGLDKAVERYAATFERQNGIRVNLRKQGEISIPEQMAIHIYRVLQESLTNVARHANTADVEVLLSQNRSTLTLEIEDRGVGFTTKAGKGLGLVAMRERAELMGGDLTVGPGRKGGALVRLVVPLPADPSPTPAPTETVVRSHAQ